MTTKFTKFLPLIISAFLVCGLSGCSTENAPGDAPELFAQSQESGSSTDTSVDGGLSTGDTSSGSSTSSTSSVSSTSGNSSSPTESTSQDVPQSTSSTEEIEPIDVKISDQSFSLPCRLGDIANISVDRSVLTFGSFNRNDGKRSSKGDFFYDDIPAGQIYLEGDCTAKENIDGARVIGLVTGDSQVPVTYMGVTFGSGREDIVNALGDPIEEDNTYMYYYIEPKGSVTFTLDSEKRYRVLRSLRICAE